MSVHAYSGFISPSLRIRLFHSFFKFLVWFKIIYNFFAGNDYLLAISYILSVSPVISYHLTSLLLLPMILDFYMNNWHLFQGEEITLLFLARLCKELIFAFDFDSRRIVIPTILLL